MRIGIPPSASTGPGAEAGVSAVGVRPRCEWRGEPQVRIWEGGWRDAREVGAGWRDVKGVGGEGWRDVKELEAARSVVGSEGRGWVDSGGEVDRKEEKDG